MACFGAFPALMSCSYFAFKSALKRMATRAGMEIPGHEAEVYDVIAWRADGSHVAWLRMRGAKLA
jgi:hypothetical protein